MVQASKKIKEKRLKWYGHVRRMKEEHIVRTILHVDLRLILHLKSHGMGNSIINWIEQWLTDRKQRVVVDGEVSSWKSVLRGVPQGSVLGHILLLVYINDLPYSPDA